MPDKKGDPFDFLKSVKPVQPSADQAVEEIEPDALTIRQMDGRYSTMRPANKNLTRIHLVDRHGKIRTLQYAFIDVESRYEGGMFRLIFAGTRHWEIIVKGHGPDFWRVYDLICLHRLPYLREATRDRASENETVFTEILWKDITPDEK